MKTRWLVVVAALWASVAGADAETADPRTLRERLDAQQRLLDAQRRQLEEQQRELDVLRRQIEALEAGEEAEDRFAAPAPEPAPPADDPELSEGELPGPGGPVVRLELPSITSEPSGLFQASIGANLNRAINTSHDGNRTKALFVDSSNIPSYVYLKASAHIHEELTLRAHLETAFQANAASRASQTNESAGFDTNGRFFELIADTKSFGKLSFGKGFASSFLAFEIDKSGTWYGNLLSVGNTAGGLLFYDSNVNDYSMLRVGDAFLDQEELSLINRVRYDSPRFRGLQLSGTVGEDNFRDVTLRYSGEGKGFEWMSGASYQDKANGPFSEWRWSGGGGVLHRPTGLNLTAGAAYSKATDDGRKAEGFAVRAGWRRRVFELGETKLVADYQRAWDITQSGSDEVSVGAFAFQDIDVAGLQLYAGYRLYEVDIDPEDLDDIHVYVIGGALQFDVTLGF